MRPSYKQNEESFNNPQPGDYWNEMFVPYFIVLECLDDGTFVICDKQKSVDHEHWTWDLSGAKQVTKTYFNRVKYGSIDGYCADVSPILHLRFVREWIESGCKYEPLLHSPVEVAADFRTVMEQGV